MKDRSTEQARQSEAVKKQQALVQTETNKQTNRRELLFVQLLLQVVTAQQSPL